MVIHGGLQWQRQKGLSEKKSHPTFSGQVLYPSYSVKTLVFLLLEGMNQQTAGNRTYYTGPAYFGKHFFLNAPSTISNLCLLLDLFHIFPILKNMPSSKSLNVSALPLPLFTQMFLDIIWNKTLAEGNCNFHKSCSVLQFLKCSFGISWRKTLKSIVKFC